MPERFHVAGLESHGSEETQCIVVRLQIDRQFNFDSQPDVARLVKALRAASDLVFRGGPEDPKK
jgi:hypothetical protein